jgi:hypothetical protein
VRHARIVSMSRVVAARPCSLPYKAIRKTLKVLLSVDQNPLAIVALLSFNAEFTSSSREFTHTGKGCRRQLALESKVDICGRCRLVPIKTGREEEMLPHRHNAGDHLHPRHHAVHAITIPATMLWSSASWRNLRRQSSTPPSPTPITPSGHW